ncbi:hypothetical protein [Longispora fulva]|uniref:Uncharacterized protein n=1 Tax=Longispora fulva TaxID=619741 RepID=A0A8J7KIP9_9ACTN|nr:hypothetical protein [Longispora fulva]MBG6134481.1 hypothetical protein [Longispora fulva]
MPPSPAATPAGLVSSPRPVPSCDAVAELMRGYFRSTKGPVAAQTIDDISGSFTSCSVRGGVDVDGGPTAMMRVTYGRAVAFGSESADKRARDTVDRQADGACVEDVVVVASGAEHAVRCGDSTPRVHEIALIADHGTFASVEFTVHSAPDPGGLRRLLAVRADVAVKALFDRIR